MKSSSGQYFQALDHVRALAVFAVFVWHFTNYNDNHHMPVLAFPLSFLTEGHTGVAIFMTLSGYLFAKLLDGKQLLYIPFLKNRALRLFPLLTFVIILSAAQAWFFGYTAWGDFIETIIQGFIFPSFPNGGWSITVELHFYIILPLLLILSKKSKFYLPLILLLAIYIRATVFSVSGDIRDLAYYTIFGRIDQFILGILLFQHKEFLVNKKYIAPIIAVLFLAFWYFFDSNLGFYATDKNSSLKFLWIFIPTIEGLAYATLIASYDNFYSYSKHWIAKFIALIGKCSFSIYLLHMFFVFRAAPLINKYIMDTSNPYVLLTLSLPVFIAFLPIAYLSYRFIETPFLRFRHPYTEEIKTP